MRRSRTLLAPLAALAFLLAACGGGDTTTDDVAAATGDVAVDDGTTDEASADDGTTDEASADGAAGARLTVVATTSIIGDVVAQVVGDAADVEVLMGPGVDPHAFSPSAAQAQLLREADVVFANGLQLEENLLDTLDAAEADGVRVVELAGELDPIEYAEGEGHDHDEDHGDEDHAEGEDHDHEDEEKDEGHGDEDHVDHEHGEFDPHVWLDAARMADAVGVITTALAEVDDSRDEAEWAAMGAAYGDELRALDAELSETLAAIPDEARQLVTNHDAYAYFADAYDFEIVDTVIPGNTTQLDTSAADFAELVEAIRDEDVTAIFTESTSSDRLAEAVAAEVGRDIQIVKLFSGALDEPGSEAGTYVGMMRANAKLVVDALAG